MVHGRDGLTRTLAIVGTILAWVPLLAPVAFSAAAFFAGGRPRLDYLMPAELFPLAFAGSGTLLWAAIRSRACVVPVAAGLATAAVSLAGGQAYAVFSGLASGATPPAGVPWVIVLASLGLYTLAVLWVGVIGLLLLRSLFRRPAQG